MTIISLYYYKNKKKRKNLNKTTAPNNKTKEIGNRMEPRQSLNIFIMFTHPKAFRPKNVYCLQK